MVYKIIFKKRFENKLRNLFLHIESEFGLLVAQKFAKQLDKKFQLLKQQPFVGQPSINIPQVRSLHAGKHNRFYYKIEHDKVIIINMYDTRINPKKNKLK